MAFFKLRSKGSPGKEGRGNVSAAPAESVESLRRRARHRLVGAAVLVLLGVIGFPLLFDTQPRPVAVDIPIEMPDRAKVKPLAQAESPAADTSRSAAGPVALPPPAGGVITERADGSEMTATTPAPAPEPRREAVASAEAAKAEPSRAEPARAEAKPEPKPEPVKTPAAKPEPKTETAKAEATKTEPAKPAPQAPSRDDGARARALLEGKPQQQVVAQAQPAAAAPAEAAGRFVVQVGAFADAAKAQETRQKLERAGLKTYTHVAKTPEGDRTRVRVGPFSSRADADKAAARIKALALPAAVLTL
ncbi:SPOR domain-containing protein [uncultured Pseudacidovorax sp.]|uniref:SPOR domain-containing protein n=1 Tax=uncultured Pseudacidovorax sp. TaxID=679313 RepID=UPI0025DEED2B|nr:SPOR domain-containing protein [uncultured Pseudacidovorax sp.]